MTVALNSGIMMQLIFFQVVYFTALFPYCILIIFFGRAVTLKGAGEGLKHMFTPDVSYGEQMFTEPLHTRKRFYLNLCTP